MIALSKSLAETIGAEGRPRNVSVPRVRAGPCVRAPAHTGACDASIHHVRDIVRVVWEKTDLTGWL